MIDKICKLWDFIKKNWEAITAVCSVIIALLSFFLTYHFNHQNQIHQKLSVRPKLVTYGQANLLESKVVIEIELINNGLGPAIIKDYKIYFDNKIIDQDDNKKASNYISEFFEKSHNKEQNVEFQVGATWNGDVISHNERKKIVVFKFPENKYDSYYEDLVSFTERLDIRVEYESMYGEKFVFFSDGKF